MTVNPTQRLTGNDLLAFYEANQEKMSKSELVKSAGFIRFNEEGKELLAFTDFYLALMEAKGVHFPTDEEREEERVKRQQERAQRRANGEKDTYTITIPVVTQMVVSVEGVAGLDHDEVCELVNREHIANAECEMEWDDMKSAWKEFDFDAWTVCVDGEDI